MRVVLATPFYPPDSGGISYHAYNLSRELSKQNDLLITACTSQRKMNLSQNGNSKIIKIPSVTPPPIPYQTLTSFRIPRAFSLISKVIRNFEPEVIHLHGHHYPLNWIIANHPSLSTIPMIITLHGLYALNPYAEKGKTLIEEIFNQTIFRKLLERNSAIIVLTPSMASYVMHYTRKRKIFAIPNGINTSNFLDNLKRKKEYREKYSLPKDKIIVLFRGRFTHVKGILDFLPVAKSLSTTRKDLYFLIVGDGYLREHVINTFQNARNVKIMSWTPEETIHELYIASDIFTLPSKWEALPITILEAMAANLVIVSTSVGGVPEILKPYRKKIFIKKSSPKEIQKSIEDATKLISIKPNGAELNYIRQFDWPKIAKKVQKVYRKVT